VNEDRGKSRWITGAFVFFGVFIVFIISLVIFVSMQSMDLVDEDYYQRELEHQSRIESLRRTQNLADELEINYDVQAQRLTIVYPKKSVSARTIGNIELYRPSDAAMDLDFDVLPGDSGLQIIEVGPLATGLWRVKIGWSSGKDEYFTQKRLIIP